MKWKIINGINLPIMEKREHKYFCSILSENKSCIF